MSGKQGANEGRIDTILGETARFKGDIQVEGGIRIDGEFEGNLRATDSVVVGRTGTVRADINSEHVNVGGKVYGNIFARRKILLESGAHLEGDVTTSSLVIAEGVFFQGACRMGEPAATSPSWDAETAEYARAQSPGDVSREGRSDTKAGLFRSDPER